MVIRIIISLSEPCINHEFLLLKGPTTAGSLTSVWECNYCASVQIENESDSITMKINKKGNPKVKEHNID